MPKKWCILFHVTLLWFHFVPEFCCCHAVLILEFGEASSLDGVMQIRLRWTHMLKDSSRPPVSDERLGPGAHANAFASMQPYVLHAFMRIHLIFGMFLPKKKL